jgi:integrase
MTNSINRLSPNNLTKLPAGVHTDGRGLALVVKTLPYQTKDGQTKTSESRSWQYIYRTSYRDDAGHLKQRTHKMGLGSLQSISLKQARKLVDDLNFQRAQGIDPATERRQRRLAQQRQAANGMTFQKAATIRIKAKSVEWKDGGKSEKQWKHSLETYAYPIIGHMDVSIIEVADVVKVLEPIWQEKTETARRVMQRMGDIFGWCITMKHRAASNPSLWNGCLANVLPSPSKFQKVIGHESIAHTDIHTVATTLRQSETLASRCALFILWTACRSSEAREARWDEFDLDNATWTVPADRMKAGKAHIVPLQPDLVTLLRETPRLANCEWVFPNASGSNCINDVTVGKAVKGCGFPSATIHGLRATFKSWSLDFGHNQQATEFQLAHSLPDATEAAYVRTVMLDARRQLMQDWLSYTLADKSKGASVTPIKTKRKA